MDSGTVSGVLRETIAVFDDSEEPKTTPEVAAHLDMSRRSTYARLERLVEHDLLETKKVGANARVWWRPAASSKETEYRRSAQTRYEDSALFASLVDAVDEYAIFALDTDGYVQTWNPGAKRIKGYDAGEILGEHFATFYTDEDEADGVPQTNLEEAKIHGTVEDEGWRVRADGSRFWANVTITAIRDDDDTLVGYAKVTRNMTERRAYEERLESQADLLKRQRDEVESELDQVFERISDGFYALDDKRRFLYLNEHAKDTLGLDDSDIGSDILDSVTATDAFEQALEEAYETGEPVVMEDYYEPVDRWFYNALYPSEDGLSVYFRDITERKEREEELELYETIVDTIEDGVYATDAEGNFVFVNDAFVSMSEHTREELLGSHGSVFFGDRFVDTDEKEWRELIAGERDSVSFETDIAGPDSETRYVQNQFVLLSFENETGRVGVTRDITVNRERERALTESERRYRTLVENFPNGVVALFDEDLQYTTAGGELLNQLGIPTDEPVGESIYERYPDEILEEVEPYFEAALEGEANSFEVEYHNRSLYASVHPLENDDAVAGMLVVQDITEQKERERELEHQREQLAALNSIHEVVTDITEAVIGQSTREEIEETVCERLADSNSYQFAWIGEVESATQTVNLRTEAGVEGYLDGITISVDPEDPRSEGPTGRALRTGEIQTTRNVEEESSHEPWRDHVESYGFQSSAAIPIVHEDSIYGALNVYAERPRAFEGREGDVISQLGEVVGHAIAATDRKRALMSDEVVALEFQVLDIFEMVDAAVETAETITMDYAVPVSDDEFLVYGTTTPEGVDTLCTLNEVVPHWTEVTVRDDSTAFEIRMKDPPVLSAVAALGGYVDSLVIEDGDARMTIHLAPNVDVRRVIDAVEETYPQAEMLRRQQITRPGNDPQHIHRELVDDLTERQRAVLDAAYHAGYFEWPRNADGTQVAESLDIALPTFSQHLRKAQKKVFDSLYATQS